MEKLLWLDDIRDPSENAWNNWIAKNVGNPLIYQRIWVKSYNEFVDWITSNGLPDVICFDHDLALEHYTYLPEEEFLHPEYTECTGKDAANWLVDYCLDNKLNLPKWAIQSSNPAGAENIRSLLKSFTKHCSNETQL